MNGLRVLTLVVSVALAAATTLAWGHRADPAPADDQQQTLKLGDIEVKGQENVVKMLRAIKAALKTPYSDSPEHADDLVCRINRKLGEASKYLDCATNRDYTRRRAAIQTGMTAAQSQSAAQETNGGNVKEANAEVALHNMVSTQPDHRLYVPVGSRFENLLRSISPSPATTVAAAPVSTVQAATSATVSAPTVGTVIAAPQAALAVPAATTAPGVVSAAAPATATLASAQQATATTPPVAATIAAADTAVAVAMPSGPAKGKACSQLDVLRAAVHRAIYAALRYPAEARYYASTGVTAISYVYLDGHVDDIHIDTPSGDRMLDRVALNAVKHADYPSSGGLAGKSVHDVVYVIFDNTGRLQRNSFGAQRDSGEEMNKDVDSRCNSD